MALDFKDVDRIILQDGSTIIMQHTVEQEIKSEVDDPLTVCNILLFLSIWIIIFLFCILLTGMALYTIIAKDIGDAVAIAIVVGPCGMIACLTIAVNEIIVSLR